MTTQRQLEANKQNAKFSTGPITEEGKACVAQNALKHGLFSKHVLIKGEVRKDFEELRTEFYQQFQPRGFLENLLVERACITTWRLARTVQLESLFINSVIDKPYVDGISEILNGPDGEKLMLLSRYETTLEKFLLRALEELRVLRSERTMSRVTNGKVGFDSKNEPTLPCNVL
jgi:hypothetical protein